MVEGNDDSSDGEFVVITPSQAPSTLKRLKHTPEKEKEKEKEGDNVAADVEAEDWTAMQDEAMLQIAERENTGVTPPRLWDFKQYGQPTISRLQDRDQATVSDSYPIGMQPVVGVGDSSFYYRNKDNYLEWVEAFGIRWESKHTSWS